MDFRMSSQIQSWNLLQELRTKGIECATNVKSTLDTEDEWQKKRKGEEDAAAETADLFAQAFGAASLDSGDAQMEYRGIASAMMRLLVEYTNDECAHRSPGYPFKMLDGNVISLSPRPEYSGALGTSAKYTYIVSSR
jgi:hypothetical protein